MNSRGLRLAAAKLASLHAADRRWLLNQLPQQQAHAVRELLARSELRHLSGQVSGLTSIHMPEPVAAAAIAAEPHAVELEALGPAWAALWLTASVPDRIDDYLSAMDAARARRVIEAATRFHQGLPVALAAAIAEWPMPEQERSSQKI
ncbi:hypothetical protein [Dyella silvatica]|uniref:hypothetical protein n=1 Tax=Dyella silvatica TaxID=2992128 RepID=UPI00225B8E05|nr:hypothetical protein [Dyella silvatica]